MVNRKCANYPFPSNPIASYVIQPPFVDDMYKWLSQKIQIILFFILKHSVLKCWVVLDYTYMSLNLKYMMHAQNKKRSPYVDDFYIIKGNCAIRKVLRNRKLYSGRGAVTDSCKSLFEREHVYCVYINRQNQSFVSKCYY